MRYIISSIAMLLVIALAVTLNAFYVRHVVDGAAELVAEAVSAYDAGEAEDARAWAEALSVYWEEKQPYLESVFSHSMLEEATLSISDLLSAAILEDTDDFYSHARLFSFQLKHIAGIEQLRWSNVL